MQRHGFRIGTLCIVILAGATAAVAQSPRRGACGQIIAACQQAGFERGGAKAGNGIGVDCIRPIMQGRPQPRRATKQLPQIAPELVAACSAANPNFGQPRAAARAMPPGQAPAPGQAQTPSEAPPPAQSLPPTASPVPN
jgi:hypothetical protein